MEFGHTGLFPVVPEAKSSIGFISNTSLAGELLNPDSLRAVTQCGPLLG